MKTASATKIKLEQQGVAAVLIIGLPDADRTKAKGCVKGACGPVDRRDLQKKSLGAAAALPVSTAIFGALVLGLSAAALLATPALPTYYMVTNKRRDLDYYHRHTQRPPSAPADDALAMGY